MKVLIIAIPRSGSTNLTLSLSKLLKIKSFQEPYNYSHPELVNRTYPEIPSEGIIIKTLFHQIPVNAIDCFSFYKEEIKKFDKVIILARKDINAAYESFNHNIEFNEAGNWHNQYIYGDIKFNLDTFNNYLKWTIEIIKFSKLHNFNITWYEDLFSNKIQVVEKVIENWGLELNSEQVIKQLSKLGKYRKYTETTLI